MKIAYLFFFASLIGCNAKIEHKNAVKKSLPPSFEKEYLPLILITPIPPGFPRPKANFLLEPDSSRLYFRSKWNTQACADYRFKAYLKQDSIFVAYAVNPKTCMKHSAPISLECLINGEFRGSVVLGLADQNDTNLAPTNSFALQRLYPNVSAIDSAELRSELKFGELEKVLSEKR